MSLENFFVEDEKPVWGTDVEKQRRLRIKLSVAAYAYELEDTSIISDHQFDHMCLEVDTSINTGNTKLDQYFREYFDPSTGQWIHKHPELYKVREIYFKYYAGLAQR